MRASRHSFPNSILLALCMVWTAILALAAPAPAQEPAIQEVRIAVQDLKTKQKLSELAPGGTLRMEVGDRVRLRMVAIPAGRNRAPRYPSTKFWGLAGTRRVNLTNIDVKVGSVDVEAVSTDNPGNNQAKTLISFEIEEDLQFPKKSMRGGTITVEVVEPPPPPPEAQQVRPDRPGFERPDPRDLEPGITLFEHQDFHGTAEKFFHDVRNLDGTRLGQDRASSVKIDHGCEAILYQHPDFRGYATVVHGSIEDLGRETVGNDSVSSIRLDCSGRGLRQYYPEEERHGGYSGDGRDREWGVTLYEHQDFEGVADTFSSDVRDLRGTRIQQDRASSVEVDRGCEAILFEHPNFQGRSTVVRGEAIADLSEERVGNDSVSSIRIDCSDRGRGDGSGDGRGDGRGDDYDRGITLYEDQDFRGVSETFTRDVRDLRGTRIQQDRASSVRIDRGCEATLYEHPDFEGRSTVVTDSIEDLGHERVGNDSVSSVRVDCFRRRR